MGQPTASLGQRANHVQLTDHTPLVSVAERVHGEQQFRLLLGARLAVLALQSLLLPGRASAWFRFTTRQRFNIATRWRWVERCFPNLQRREIRRRYFFARRAHVLLDDGEQTYATLPYRRRRLRFATVFWCRPRFFRFNRALVLVLRGYNITAPAPRRRRPRRRLAGRALVWLQAQRRVAHHHSPRTGWF
jgi:hypothetical protein